MLVNDSLKHINKPSDHSMSQSQDVPEGGIVSNLHILWQTDSHCPNLAVSGEFTKHLLFQVLCNHNMMCKGCREWNNSGLTDLFSRQKQV